MYDHRTDNPRRLILLVLSAILITAIIASTALDWKQTGSNDAAENVTGSMNSAENAEFLSSENISDTNATQTEYLQNHYVEILDSVPSGTQSYCDSHEYQRDCFSIDELGAYTRQGMFFVECTDPVEMNQGNHYAVHTVTDNGNVLLDNKSFSMDITIMNNTIPISFTYAEYDGNVFITYIPPQNQHPGLRFINDTTQGVHQVLVTFSFDGENGEQILYPAYLDLETGVICDFLCDADPEILAEILTLGICDSFISEDGSVVFKLNDGQWFYSSAQGNSIFDLEKAVGMRIQDCILLSEEIICWNTSGDFWSVDTTVSSAKRIFSGLNAQFFHGISEGSPCSFILYKDDAEALHVYDFLEKTDILLANVGEWNIGGGLCHPSPDGRRFLISKKDNNGCYLFAVYNCNTNTFTSFTRQNADNRTEDSLEWNHANQVLILSSPVRELCVYSIK